MKASGTAIVAVLIATPVLAADTPAGQRLAQVWCRGCHVVDNGQLKTRNDAVPSFSSIAQMKSTTATSLAAFLSTSHGRMPDYGLSRQEIRDVSAYILTLRK
jgi:mono/diheme cytochrome c family protein